LVLKLFLIFQKLAVNEVGLLLWYAFTHATADALRITALSVSSPDWPFFKTLLWRSSYLKVFLLFSSVKKHILKL